MNLEINIAKLPPVSPISTRICKLFQNIELLTTPTPWYILAGGLLCFIKLTCLPISLSIYRSRQTCSVLTVRDPFSLPFCIGPVSSLFCNCLSVCHLKKVGCYTATTQCFLLVFCLFFISLSPASLLWSKLFLMLSNWHHCSHFYLSFCL